MFGAHSIDEMLARKAGHFRVEMFGNRPAITVHRPGQMDEVIICLSLGHANQMRQALTDEGLAGYFEGAI